MRFQVMGNRVLIKRLEEPGLKSSSIIIVQNDREPGHYALVAGVGPGKWMPNGMVIPIGVREGDLVILAKYSGAPITLKNDAGEREEFQLVDADDVLAVMIKPTTVPVVK